jgi:hypothetical protein
LAAAAACGFGRGKLRFPTDAGTVEFLPTSGVSASASGDDYIFRSIATKAPVAYLWQRECLEFEGTGERATSETIGGLTFDRVRVVLPGLGTGTAWRLFVSASVGRVAEFNVIQFDRDAGAQSDLLVQQILRAITVSPR